MNARTALLVTLTACIFAAPAARARAATYEVSACADHPALAAGAFTAANSNPSTLTTPNGCARDPVGLLEGLAATDRGGSANTPAGAVAGWTIAAAPGTMITSLRARRYIGKRDNTWDVWVRTGSGQVLETCQIVASLSCTEGALPTSPQSLHTYTGLNAQSVAFGISCAAAIGECVNGLSLNRAWAVVYAATATVEDPAVPTLQPVGGTLLAPVDWHQGVEQATLAASDVSGIKRLELLIDGVPRAAADQACDYSLMRPCPTSAQLQANVDLARLADGVHQIAARATDAANQSATSPSTAIAVDTHAPTAPSGLTVSTNADRAITARWRNPDQDAGAPITAAHFQFCPLGSDIGCVGGGIVPGPGITAIEHLQPPAGGSPWELLVWLQDAAGHADRMSAVRRLIDPKDDTNGGSHGQNGSGGGHDGHGRDGNQRSRRSSPRLRITRVIRRARRVVVRGTVARAVRARVVVAFRTRRGSRPVARRSTTPRNGRFRVVLRLPDRSARAGGLVSARVAASRLHRAQTVVKTAPRAGQRIQRGGSGRDLRQGAVPDWR